jgi:hypothetical protein
MLPPQKTVALLQISTRDGSKSIKRGLQLLPSKSPSVSTHPCPLQPTSRIQWSSRLKGINLGCLIIILHLFLLI